MPNNKDSKKDNKKDNKKKEDRKKVKPSLIGNLKKTDLLAKEAKKEIKKPDLIPTETDLRFDILANSAKMKEPKKEKEEKKKDKSILDQLTESDFNMEHVKSDKKSAGKKSAGKKSTGNKSAGKSGKKSSKSELPDLDTISDTLQNLMKMDKKQSGKKSDKKSSKKSSKSEKEKEEDKDKETEDKTEYKRVPKEDQNTEEWRKKKLEMLGKLKELMDCGVQISKDYDMDDDYYEMENEYLLQRQLRDKQNGVRWYRNLLMNVVAGLEYLNETYDPFKFKLSGWSEQVYVNVNDYNEVFGELFEKYKTKGGKVPPEIKLLMMIIASAVSFHLTNTLFKTLPGLDNIVKNNPDFMQKLASQLTSGSKQEMPQRKQKNDSDDHDKVSKKEKHDKPDKKVEDKKMEEMMKQQQSMINQMTQLQGLNNQLMKKMNGQEQELSTLKKGSKLNKIDEETEDDTRSIKKPSDLRSRKSTMSTKDSNKSMMSADIKDTFKNINRDIKDKEYSEINNDSDINPEILDYTDMNDNNISGLVKKPKKLSGNKSSDRKSSGRSSAKKSKKVPIMVDI